jgi:hypothetical protein
MSASLPPWCPSTAAASLPEGDGRERCLANLALLADEVSAPWPRLAKRVDDSTYDLRQWFQALADFDRWLEAEGRQAEAPIDHRLGYIECATQSPEAASLSSDLSAVLAEMLELYGYVGS